MVDLPQYVTCHVIICEEGIWTAVIYKLLGLGELKRFKVYCFVGMEDHSFLVEGCHGFLYQKESEV